ncbi:hypothetical protein LPUS_11792 [Lasallia pustulata]|uniref:Uncharacterized protein n=1 Tax=Lasallia pustulata TaxID=136370 RepID=A0A1W5DCN5_9LECA|nr:hypothetical protein LPUS_11792 [Lasallia pustulata]
MGLPMFREPEASDSKVVIKADASAHARSSIRRQRTVRYNPHIHHDHPSSSRSRVYNNQPRDLDRRLLLQIIHRGRATPSSNGHNSASEHDVEAEADLAHAEASNRRRYESGRALLRDALSFERPGERMRIPGDSPRRFDVAPPLPTVPDPRDYAGQRRGRVEYYVDLSRSEDGTRASSDTHEAVPTPGAALLTPRFAPAYRFEESSPASHRLHSSSQALDDDASRLRGGDLDELPPLRRMGNRSYHDPFYESHDPSIRHPLDGLGDRRRSFSPDDDTWETLLTTIAPDEHLPSAHSSFTSATASASSLSSNSASSSATVLTAPSSSSAESFDVYPTICENSDSEESDGEDEHYAILQASRRDDQRPRGFNGYPGTAHDRLGGAARQLGSRLARLRRQGDGHDELGQIHAILDRFPRRDYVPDELWAAVGLPRLSGGREDRGVDRERL